MKKSYANWISKLSSNRFRRNSRRRSSIAAENFGFSGFTVKEVFTAETQSSQSFEELLMTNSLLRALRASAVQSPNPCTGLELGTLPTGKPEEPEFLCGTPSCRVRYQKNIEMSSVMTKHTGNGSTINLTGSFES